MARGVGGRVGGRVRSKKEGASGERRGEARRERRGEETERRRKRRGERRGERGAERKAEREAERTGAERHGERGGERQSSCPRPAEKQIKSEQVQKETIMETKGTLRVIARDAECAHLAIAEIRILLSSSILYVDFEKSFKQFQLNILATIFVTILKIIRVDYMYMAEKRPLLYSNGTDSAICL